MTGGALFRRRFVDENSFAIYDSIGFVTTAARSLAVRTHQGERRLSVMIEVRRFPPLAVVACIASRLAPARELLTMHVGMAAFALVRGYLEVDASHSCIGIDWLVTCATCDRAMSSQELE